MPTSAVWAAASLVALAMSRTWGCSDSPSPVGTRGYLNCRMDTRLWRSEFSRATGQLEQYFGFSIQSVLSDECHEVSPAGRHPGSACETAQTNLKGAKDMSQLSTTGAPRRTISSRWKRGAAVAAGVAVVGTVLAAGGPSGITASSHREAPLIEGDPLNDYTDVY